MSEAGDRMSQPDDNVVFLTGAADGLGREIARELAAAGLRLALFDIQAGKLKSLATELTRAGTTLEDLFLSITGKDHGGLRQPGRDAGHCNEL